MGQHKHNETAIAAKEGLLPPKEKRMTKAETKRYLQGLVYEHMRQKSPAIAMVMDENGQLKQRPGAY